MNITQSSILFERSKKIVPGGVHSPVRAFRGVGGVPRFIESAQGAYLHDVDGNRYLDYCMSWGPMLLGHQDPDVKESVQSALHRGWSFGTAEPYSLELAELMTQTIPWVQKVRFVNSGTEAVMAALRVARAATGRSKILKFDGCYHGHADSLLVRAGSGLADMASPDSAGVSQNVASETIVVPLDDWQRVEQVFEEMGHEIAAVIFEGVPANNGLLLQREDFLRKLAQRAKPSGALLILDEVITGFRVAWGGMAERAGIEPDLVTYGKVIGGGFPVGAYGGRADLMDLVAPAGPVYQAGTLSANPVAMVAGLTTLKKLRKLNPYHELESEVERSSRALEGMAKELGIALQVQRFASLFWCIFGEIQTQDGMVRSPSMIPAVHKEVYSQVFHGLLEKGIYMAPSAFEVSFLSLAHRREHQDYVLDSMREVLRECRRG